ncbi:MAG: hypothetical protein U9P10_05925 [Thermodesulfobacteriota bacterium]|nr:hypothetical protein [Thermodesulfobacteriota bacterium]
MPIIPSGISNSSIYNTYTVHSALPGTMDTLAPGTDNIACNVEISAKAMQISQEHTQKKHALQQEYQTEKQKIKEQHKQKEQKIKEEYQQKEQKIEHEYRQKKRALAINDYV